MFNTLTKKTYRDIFDSWARALLVVSAIAVSTLTLGIILGSYDILSRALSENFNIVKPSHISLNVDSVSNAQLGKLQDLALVESIDTRGIVRGRIKAPNNTIPLLLFVVPNFESMQVNKLNLAEGRWPTSGDEQLEILVERQAMNLLPQDIGGKIEIIDSNERLHSLSITGTAHDAVQAQAEWENLVYGYIKPEAASAMGIAVTTTEINVILADPYVTSADENAVPPEITKLLSNEGVLIKSNRINLKAEHPHANVTKGMFTIQNAFAYALALMSAILVFNLLSAQLAKQHKQISILKTLGAKSSQVSLIYFRSITTLCIGALAIAIPSAIVLSKIYVDQLALMLNIDIHSYAISMKTLFIQIGVGLLLPLAAVALPIWRASRSSIRSGLLDYAGGKQANLSSGKSLGLITSAMRGPYLNYVLNRAGRPAVYALRNNFRNKSRSFMMGTVFCLAGVLFSSSFNISQSMRNTVDTDTNSKAWHFQIQFRDNSDLNRFSENLTHPTSRNNIHQEPFNFEHAEINNEKYPSTLGLTYIDSRSKMITPYIIDGHWLADKHIALDTTQSTLPIILNQSAFKALNNPKINKGKEKEIGDLIELTIQNKTQTFRIEGVVQTIAMPQAFTSQMPNSSNNGLFIRIDDIQKEQIYEWENKLRQTAKQNGIAIKSFNDRWHTTEILVDHFAILFTLMMMLSTAILFISANGIALNLVTNTLERTREIGVLKAIGASKGYIKGMLYIESAILAIAAWILGSVLSIPISAVLSNELGNLLIKTPLLLSFDIHGYLLALPLMLCVAFLASIVPANKIAKKPIRNALAYS